MTLWIINSETDLWILLYYMAAIFCVVILFMQIVGIMYNASRIDALNHESWVSKQGGMNKILISLFTTYSMSILGIAVAISRLGNHIYDPILCEHSYMLTFMFAVTAKMCNYYFFLARARLAQGMSPIIPEIYFNKVFPALFITVYIFYIFMVTL